MRTFPVCLLMRMLRAKHLRLAQGVKVENVSRGRKQVGRGARVQVGRCEGCSRSRNCVL